MARHNADGSLDTVFGSNGRVITNFGATEQALALVLQPDGKIVVAGRTNKPAPNGNFDFALARYESGGAVDNTFGTLGLVTTDFGGSVDRAFAMALQPDGKLVVAGDSDANFALARYNSNGSLDASFGAGGKVITSFRRYRPGLGGDPAAGRQDRRGRPDGHGHQHRLRPRALQLRTAASTARLAAAAGSPRTSPAPATTSARRSRCSPTARLSSEGHPTTISPWRATPLEASSTPPSAPQAR